MSFTSLKSHFLIAMPRLADTAFASSLTVICEHSPQGALGIIVNRPTTLTLEEIYRQVGIEHPGQMSGRGNTVYSGGPVAVERGFVLHTGERGWESCLPVCKGLYLTTSKDILVSMAQRQGPEESLVALGYAGWGAGQLEQELADNVWLNCEVDTSIIFDTPVHLRLNRAASSLGIDLGLISSDIGHA